MSFKDRISEHLWYVTTQMLKKKATRDYFIKPGHTSASLRATVLEKIHSDDIFYRKKRETYYV